MYISGTMSFLIFVKWISSCCAFDRRLVVNIEVNFAWNDVFLTFGNNVILCGSDCTADRGLNGGAWRRHAESARKFVGRAS